MSKSMYSFFQKNTNLTESNVVVLRKNFSIVLKTCQLQLNVMMFENQSLVIWHQAQRQKQRIL